MSQAGDRPCARRRPRRAAACDGAAARATWTASPRGGRDVPLVLLPLLNDLRAVRGGPLLSEGTLLLLNLRSDEPARPAPCGRDRIHRVADLARKLATPLPARAARLDPRRERGAQSRGPRRDRRPARGPRHDAAAVPAVVGGRRGARGAARGRPRQQRLGEAPARPRRPRDEAAAGAGRGALRRQRRRSSCSTTCCITWRGRSTAGPRVAAVRALVPAREVLADEQQRDGTARRCRRRASS